MQSLVKGIHVLLLRSGQALLLLNTKAIFKAMIWLTYKPIKPEEFPVKSTTGPSA